MKKGVFSNTQQINQSLALRPMLSQFFLKVGRGECIGPLRYTIRVLRYLPA